MSYIYNSSKIMQKEIGNFHKNAFKKKVISIFLKNPTHKANNRKVVNYMKIIFIKSRNAIRNSLGKQRRIISI